nr:hypothetical protein [uncultured Bacteroides sp.]
MRTFYYFILIVIGVVGISSCSQDDNELDKVNNQKIQTKSLAESDSTCLDSIITPLIVNPDSIKRPLTRAAYSTFNEDEYFSANMWAIRELPITLQARGQANTSSRYLSTNGKSKEITLVNYVSSRSNNQLFYLRILPASSGIPYLIYSYQDKTPISVGQYNSDPNNKILFTLPNESGSLYSAGWDLIPSDYKGYFAIQSQSYLGQSDPNNMWSVFNYVLEVKNDNKVGYGQYTKKAQQEFLIVPFNAFTLSYIEFYKDGATVTKQTPLKVVTYGKNESEERRPFTIEAAHYAYDTSSFSESSILKIPIKNTTDNFYRPTVEAEHIVTPLAVKPSEDTSHIRKEADMVYSSTTQKILNTLKFNIDGTALPNSLIEATSYLENYTVSVKYTAHMTYKYNGEEREVKINGVWSGAIYTTIRDNKYPKDIIKFFDLDDGTEILRTRSATLSPITFK